MLNTKRGHGAYKCMVYIYIHNWINKCAIQLGLQQHKLTALWFMHHKNGDAYLGENSLYYTGIT